jgi:hypothetical protein
VHTPPTVVVDTVVVVKVPVVVVDTVVVVEVTVVSGFKLVSLMEVVAVKLPVVLLKLSNGSNVTVIVSVPSVS